MDVTYTLQFFLKQPSSRNMKNFSSHIIKTLTSAFNSQLQSQFCFLGQYLGIDL